MEHSIGMTPDTHSETAQLERERGREKMTICSEVGETPVRNRFSLFLCSVQQGDGGAFLLACSFYECGVSR